MATSFVRWAPFQATERNPPPSHTRRAQQGSFGSHVGPALFSRRDSAWRRDGRVGIRTRHEYNASEFDWHWYQIQADGRLKEEVRWTVLEGPLYLHGPYLAGPAKRRNWNSMLFRSSSGLSVVFFYFLVLRCHGINLIITCI